MEEKNTTNAKIPTPGSAAEKNQAETGSPVREGQEDSSILHDKHDDQKELTGTPKPKIDPATSQEEFIDDQRQ